MHTDQQNIYIYRDILLPPSEGFVPRHYGGFSQLRPIYIGSRRTSFFDQYGADSILTGTHGLARYLYKYYGIVSGIDRFNAHNPQLIHAHFGRGGALALPLAKKLDIPLVVTFHGGDVMKEKHYASSRFYSVYQRRLSALKSYGTAFLCVSDFLKKHLIKRGFPEDKVHTHYIGIDLPKQPPELSLKSTRNHLLFVGRLVEKKGVDCLLRALKNVQENHPTIGLSIIGEGPLEEELKALTNNLQLDHVNFLGWQSPEQVAHAMQTHLALCTPSQQATNGDCEGLPTVIMEAQYHGAPVIATRHAGIPEIIVDGKTGFLSDERDVEGLTHNIQALLNNTEEQYNVMQHAALDCLYKHFNAATQSQALEQLFIDIIARHE